MKTFTCNFGAGVTCTIKVDDAPLAAGKIHIRECSWSRIPARKTIRPYVAWMNIVNRQLANEWGLNLIHVFQTSPTTIETWFYEPGKPARRTSVKKLASQSIRITQQQP